MSDIHNKAAARSTSATSSRTLARGEYLGRNGEVLTRTETSGIDAFDIRAELREPGWDLQWLTETIINDPDTPIKHKQEMYKNGWREVHAQGRWNGVFAPPSYTGHIRVGSSGLYERPMKMTLEAQAEDLARAQRQMRDRDSALMGGRANVRGAMRDGIEMGGKYRGTGADLRMSISPELDAPKPSYRIAEPGE